MCAGENLLERERKETCSRLKKNLSLLILLFFFFLFLGTGLSTLLIFLEDSNSVFCRSFPVRSYFHLSEPVPSFSMGLNLAILERFLNGNISKPVLHRSKIFFRLSSTRLPY